MNWLIALWRNSIPQQSWIWHPGYPSVVRWLVWNFLRNPLGFLLKLLAIHEKTKEPNFNPNGGWEIAFLYVSYRGVRPIRWRDWIFIWRVIEFYIGFRPSTGVLGFSLRVAHASNEKGQPV